jgi:hypothetical protein
MGVVGGAVTAGATGIQHVEGGVAGCLAANELFLL